MSPKSKLAFLSGLVMLGVVIAGLLLYLDYSNSRVSAKEASIKAESYSVGIDYSGLISKQFVEEGDRVVAGQELFYIQSNVLKQSMQELGLKREDLLYPLNDKGEIILKASKNGVVSNIEFNQGSFVPANKEIAQIMSSDVIFADATFRIPERDFARIKKGTQLQIDLPNGQVSSGTVTNIKVQSQKESEVTAVVQTKLKNLDVSGFISASGTPVQAKLILNPNSFYDDKIQPLMATVLK